MDDVTAITVVDKKMIAPKLMPDNRQGNRRRGVESKGLLSDSGAGILK
jgi:hypothetical protein